MTTHSGIFLNEIETFLKRHDMGHSTFGTMTCGDSNFVRDLRRGRKPNVDLVEHVVRWMELYDDQMVLR